MTLFLMEEGGGVSFRADEERARRETKQFLLAAEFARGQVQSARNVAPGEITTPHICEKRRAMSRDES